MFITVNCSLEAAEPNPSTQHSAHAAKTQRFTDVQRDVGLRGSRIFFINYINAHAHEKIAFTDLASNQANNEEILVTMSSVRNVRTDI